MLGYGDHHVRSIFLQVQFFPSASSFPGSFSSCFLLLGFQKGDYFRVNSGSDICKKKKKIVHMKEYEV